MTVEMLERIYGHHHPDFQREAAEGIARSPGQDRDSIHREQNATNVIGRAQKLPINQGEADSAPRSVGVALSNPRRQIDQTKIISSSSPG